MPKTRQPKPMVPHLLQWKTNLIRPKTMESQLLRQWRDPVNNTSVHLAMDWSRRITKSGGEGASPWDLQGHQKNLKQSGGRMKDWGSWYNICNVSCTSELDMDSHLNGRRHFNRINYNAAVWLGCFFRLLIRTNGFR